MGKSDLEAELAFQIRAYGLPDPEREFRFHETRRWRFDFAFPNKMLAVEVEGGIWTGGRHVRGKGFGADAEKMNEAALLGWTVLRFTPTVIRTGEAVAMIERAMNNDR